MADDKSDRGPADRDRINIHEDYEVRYWTKKFGVTKAELVEAVKAVGVMAKDVAKYFNK
ncbi:MAG: DUF3606 domain-containing protein [Rhizomicrobium sp.]